jgi:hypothetical protein
VQRLLKKNSEPHTGARPSVRLCVGPELARCVHHFADKAGNPGAAGARTRTGRAPEVAILGRATKIYQR